MRFTDSSYIHVKCYLPMKSMQLLVVRPTNFYCRGCTALGCKIFALKKGWARPGCAQA